MSRFRLIADPNARGTEDPWLTMMMDTDLYEALESSLTIKQGKVAIDMDALPRSLQASVASSLPTNSVHSPSSAPRPEWPPRPTSVEALEDIKVENVNESFYDLLSDQEQELPFPMDPIPPLAIPNTASQVDSILQAVQNIQVTTAPDSLPPLEQHLAELVESLHRTASQLHDESIALDKRAAALNEREQALYADAEAFLERAQSTATQFGLERAMEAEKQADLARKESRRLQQVIRELTASNRQLREQLKVTESQREKEKERISALERNLKQMQERDARLKPFRQTLKVVPVPSSRSKETTSAATCTVQAPKRSVSMAQWFDMLEYLLAVHKSHSNIPVALEQMYASRVHSALPFLLSALCPTPSIHTAAARDTCRALVLEWAWKSAFSPVIPTAASLPREMAEACGDSWRARVHSILLPYWQQKRTLSFMNATKTQPAMPGGSAACRVLIPLLLIACDVNIIRMVQLVQHLSQLTQEEDANRLLILSYNGLEFLCFLLTRQTKEETVPLVCAILQLLLCLAGSEDDQAVWHALWRARITLESSLHALQSITAVFPLQVPVMACFLKLFQRITRVPACAASVVRYSPQIVTWLWQCRAAVDVPDSIREGTRQILQNMGVL